MGSAWEVGMEPQSFMPWKRSREAEHTQVISIQCDYMQDRHFCFPKHTLMWKVTSLKWLTIRAQADSVTDQLLGINYIATLYVCVHR